MAITINGNGTITGISTGGLPDGIVDTDMIAANAVTAAKSSGLANQGITEFDSWRITSSYAIPSGWNNYITANWIRDNTNFEKIGTGLSESNGVFSFPSTGKYLINFSLNLYRGSAGSYLGGYMHLSTDGGTNFSRKTEFFTSTGTGSYEQLTSYKMFDVTDANYRMKFELEVQGSGTEARGHSSQNRTGFTCLRLGDT